VKYKLCNSVLAYMGCTRGNNTDGIPDQQPQCAASDDHARDCQWSPIYVKRERDPFNPLFGGTNYAGPRPVAQAPKTSPHTKTRARVIKRVRQVSRGGHPLDTTTELPPAQPIKLIEPIPISDLMDDIIKSGGIRWG